MIFLELFWVFFKIGLFSFGGGYAMVSGIQNEILARAWMGAEQYADIVTISQMTPGPLAVNVATYVGANVLSGGGPWLSILGGVVATFGVALPSFILVIVAAKLYEKVYEKRQTQWVLAGIRPAVVGLVANAMIFFVQLSILSGGWLAVGFPLFGTVLTVNFGAAAIFAVILLLNLKTKIGPIWLIVISAALGLMLM